MPLTTGKQLKGLETLVEQLQAMDELPVEFHLEALIETLELGDNINDVMETTTDLYLSGDIGMAIPLMKTVSPEGARRRQRLRRLRAAHHHRPQQDDGRTRQADPRRRQCLHGRRRASSAGRRG